MISHMTRAHYVCWPIIVTDSNHMTVMWPAWCCTWNHWGMSLIPISKMRGNHQFTSLTEWKDTETHVFFVHTPPHNIRFPPLPPYPLSYSSLTSLHTPHSSHMPLNTCLLPPLTNFSPYSPLTSHTHPSHPSLTPHIPHSPLTSHTHPSHIPSRPCSQPEERSN